MSRRQESRCFNTCAAGQTLAWSSAHAQPTPCRHAVSQQTWPVADDDATWKPLVIHLAQQTFAEGGDKSPVLGLRRSRKIARSCERRCWRRLVIIRQHFVRRGSGAHIMPRAQPAPIIPPSCCVFHRAQKRGLRMSSCSSENVYRTPHSRTC